MTAARSIDVVIPVRNEARTVVRQLLSIHSDLDDAYRGVSGLTVTMTVVVNGTTDATARVCRSLVESLPGLRVEEQPAAGKGAAVRHGWLTSTADVVAYTDLDQSVPLSFLPLLTGPLIAGAADVTVANRYHPGSRVHRSIRRAVPSVVLRSLVWIALRPPVSDAACSLKAAHRAAVSPVLEAVRDGGRAFDVELLVRSSVAGLRVWDVPVAWTQGSSSYVHMLPESLEVARAVLRLRRDLHSSAD